MKLYKPDQLQASWMLACIWRCADIDPASILPL